MRVGWALLVSLMVQQGVLAGPQEGL